jgi:PKHD-type hydroxylase
MVPFLFFQFHGRSNAVARFANSFTASQNSRFDLTYSCRLFSKDECERVIKWAERSSWKRTARYAPGPYENPMEPAHVLIESTKDPEIVWLPRRLKNIVGTLNERIWRFDLTRLSKVLVVRYGQTDAMKIHTDLENDKKLAVVLQLSPTDAYEGGMLELGLASDSAAPTEQGSVLVFPTWVPHRVTPITSGTRYIAVCFAIGPSFR